MKFSIGLPTITPSATKTLEQHNIKPFDLLERHSKGDWGDVCEDDKQSNETALLKGYRLLSAYYIDATESEKVWIITEADRSTTTILLPEEY